MSEADPELWVCYCGQRAPRSEWFPHEDCDGGRPLAADEITATGGEAA